MNLTNGRQGWIWKSISIEGGAVRTLDGPLRDVPKLASYSIALFITCLCVRWLVRSTGLRDRQAWLILLASVVSWAGHRMTFLPHMARLAPLPLSFLLSSAITAWAFHRWRMNGIVPLARDAVVQNMIDGLMVVDDSQTIVALNPTARAIFPEPAVAVGASFQGAAAVWPALADFESEAAVAAEVSRNVDGSACFFHVTGNPLRTPLGHSLGRVLIFKDVTIEHRQQAILLEEHKALSALTERQRLGRELHDGPGQIWSFVTMQVHAARILLARRDFARARRRLDRLAEVVREAHLGLRESIIGLQGGVSGEQGLLEAIEEQAQWYRENCELDVELALRCEWRADLLSPAIKAQAVRIVQEALANVRKSARASRVRIVVERDVWTIELRVEDDGCGFDAAEVERQTGHHGLRIMRERAADVGARLNLESAPGQGTRVRLFLPIASSDAP